MLISRQKLTLLLVSIQAERDCRQRGGLTIKVILLDLSLDPKRELLLDIQLSSPLLPAAWLTINWVTAKQQHSIHLCIRTAG